MKKVVFFLPSFSHEDQRQTLKLLVEQTTSEFGENIQHSMITKFADLKSLNSDSVLITDSMSRFGSIEQACQVIFNLRVQKNIEIFIPTHVDLRDSNQSLGGVAGLVSALCSIRSELKSKRIRQSLWIKSQLQGRVHDSGISAELKRMVIEEHERCGAVRKTARNLKSIGHNISASSVSRILKEAKSNG